MNQVVIKTILVDDDLSSVQNLEKLLTAFDYIKIIDKETDPEKALGKIVVQNPDLIFLDIQMPGMTGFELLSGLNNAGIAPLIIFVTAFDQFAIKAIRHSAFDFLLKPVNSEELKTSVGRLLLKINSTDKQDRIRQLVERTSRPRIKLNSSGGFMLVRPEDIIYVEADWNYSEVYFGNDKKETITQNMGSVAELLPPGEFYRISRSIIINLNYLVKVSRRKMTAYLIKDGVEYTFKIPLLKIRQLERFLEE